MNYPDDVLLAMLKAGYNLDVDEIRVDDITWETEDWSENDHGNFRPYVCVRHAGFKRHQPVEPTVYTATFIVQVIWWPDHVSKVPEKKRLVWQIIEKLKKEIDYGTAPTGWSNMWFETLTNLTILSVSPNMIMEQIAVNATVLWDVSAL